MLLSLVGYLFCLSRLTQARGLKLHDAMQWRNLQAVTYPGAGRASRRRVD